MDSFKNSRAIAPLCSIISEIVAFLHKEAMYCTYNVTLWHLQVNAVAFGMQQ